MIVISFALRLCAALHACEIHVRNFFYKIITSWRSKSQPSVILWHSWCYYCHTFLLFSLVLYAVTKFSYMSHCLFCPYYKASARNYLLIWFMIQYLITCPENDGQIFLFILIRYFVICDYIFSNKFLLKFEKKQLRWICIKVDDLADI